MPHGVIFDIDDTLLHSMEADDRLYRQAIVDVAGPVRFRATLADYDHVSDEGIVRQVLEDNSIEAAIDTLQTIRDIFLRSLRAHVDKHGPFEEIDGARQVLGRLVASDHHAVALATGCWRASAELKLHTAGFDVAGLPLATADDAMERVAIMRHARGQLPDELDSITYFGDGVWDQRACEELGWAFRPVGPGLNGIRGYDNEYADLPG